MSCCNGTAYITIGKAWTLTECGFEDIGDFEFIYYVGSWEHGVKRTGDEVSGGYIDDNGYIVVPFASYEVKVTGTVKVRRVFVYNGKRYATRDTLPVYITREASDTVNVRNKVTLKADSNTDGNVCTTIQLQNDCTTTDVLAADGNFSITERGFDSSEDFKFVYYVRSTAFVAQNESGTYTNCTCNDDGSVTVEFPESFNAEGRLRCNRTLYYNKKVVEMEDALPVFVTQTQGALTAITHIIHFRGGYTCPFYGTGTGTKGEKGDKGDPGEDAIYVLVTSDKGNILRNGLGEVTLTATAYKGSEELTDLLTENNYSWTRVSSDTDGDTTWNNRHVAYGRTLVITAAEFYSSALFECYVNAVIP